MSYYSKASVHRRCRMRETLRVVKYSLVLVVSIVLVTVLPFMAGVLISGKYPQLKNLLETL